MKNTIQTNKSLIMQDDNQLDLLTPSQIDSACLGDISKPGKRLHTGAGLYDHDPSKYNLIVSLLADGSLGIKKIAMLTRTSIHTVIAVRTREPKLVATLKKRIAAMCSGVVHATIESLLDDLDDDVKISPKDKSIIIGVLIDKWQLLNGEATERIELTKGKPEQDKYNEMLREYEAMRLGEEKKETKELDPGEVEVGPAAGGSPESPATKDYSVPLPSSDTQHVVSNGSDNTVSAGEKSQDVEGERVTKVNE